MKFLDFFSRLDTLFTVHRCLACRATVSETTFLCPSCFEVYKQERLWECGICGKPLSDCTCVNAYLESAAVHRAVKLLRYQTDMPEALGNRVLYRLKRHHISRIYQFFAKELAQAVRKLIQPDEKFVVAHVIRSHQQEKKYGFDQSACLARALAAELGLVHISAIRREKRSRIQKNITGAEARKENAKGAFSPKKGISLRGKHVLLLDDIVTTGASMAECARVLRRMGAREIIAVSVAISYRQPNIKYEHDANTHEERFWLKSK